MTQENETPEITEEVIEQAQEAQEVAAEAPMNRAQRRAMAAGKKGAGGNPALPHQSNMRGPGTRGSGPASQGRIQSRGASRGK